MDFCTYSGLYLLSDDNKMFIYKGFDNYEESELFKGISGIHGLSINDSTIFCIDENDNVYATGSNYNKQFGLGDGQKETYYDEIVNLSERVSILAGKKIKKVKAASTSGVLDENGDLYVSGDNWFGAIGNGNNSDQKSFIKVNNFIDGKVVKDFSICEYGAMVITEDDKFYITGSYQCVPNAYKNEYACVTDNVDILKNKKIVKGALSSEYAACIDSDGKLYVWGSRWSDYGNIPMCFSDSEYAGDLKGKKIVDVDISDYRVIAVDEKGEAYDFGGEGASIGREDTELYAKSLTNRNHSSLKGRKVTRIISQKYNECFLFIDENNNIHFTGDSDSNEYPGFKEDYVNVSDVICLSELREGFITPRVASIDGCMLDSEGHLIFRDIKNYLQEWNFDFDKSYKKIISTASWGEGNIAGLDNSGKLYNAYRDSESYEYLSEEMTGVKYLSNIFVLKEDNSLYYFNRDGRLTLINSSDINNKKIKQLSL